MMKAAILTLLIIIIPVFIIYFFVSSFDKDMGKQYAPPVCGNHICERGEEPYCLDCNLSCKSKFCNSKLNVICDNCDETQQRLFSVLTEHQSSIYDCLSDYYRYHPQRLVYHSVTRSSPKDVCIKKEGCYVTGGTVDSLGIRQGFIPGLREYNAHDVTKSDNVGYEIHELSHIFTSYGLGLVPLWFTEGISIYTESKISCHPDYVLSNKINDFLSLYNQLKNKEKILNEIAPYGEYYETEHNSHIIGAIYFGALEQDYDCDKECVSDILYALHEYRINCTGECFEEAKESISELTNVSLNNKDLRIQIVTNALIKQKSEEITNRNLTRLYELLEIKY